jgi:hypothetical protein
MASPALDLERSIAVRQAQKRVDDDRAELAVLEAALARPEYPGGLEQRIEELRIRIRRDRQVILNLEWPAKPSD